MKLNDPNTIGFDGTPVTGRVPPQLRVDGGRELTQQQLGAVMHAYKLFRDALRVSVTPFLVQNRTLTDGTRVRMESMQDRDIVYVWPTGGGAEVKLPHGFAVETNWRATKIFKRRLSWPMGETQWKFAPDHVPQVARGDDQVYDNQVFRKPADRPWFSLPMVLHKATKVLWDYARRGAAALSGGAPTAIRIKNNTTGAFTLFPAHYAADNKIVDLSATTLYTMADETPILGPLSPDYPDPVSYFPSATDAEGNQVAMNAWRYAVLSPTFNIWKFRLWNERLRRTGDAAYEAIERNTTDFITPWGKQTATVTNIVDGNLGENPELMLKFRWTDEIDSATAGYVSDAPVPGTYHWVNGWKGTERWQDLTGINYSSSGMAAQRIVKIQEEAATTIYKVLAAPTQNETTYIDIESKLNYPAQIFWRGGEQMKGFSRQDLIDFWLGPIGYDPYIGMNYRVERATLYRKDTSYDVDGTPSVTAKLGWKDLKLLEGTTTGRMSGKEYDNKLNQAGSYNLHSYTFILKNHPPGGTDRWWFLVANDSKPEYLADWMAHGTGPNSTEIWEHPFNIRPANTVDYNLTSRYVIDYDHKGRFYAAIRCEVVCTGAEWEENRAVYDGFMQTKTDPTYVVKIWFESNWNGVGAEQLLVQETVTRPAFECITVPMFNPWYWMGYAYIDRDCKVRTPPEPTPDENFMFQLKNLASHQGVNTNLCCADVRPDITGDDIALTQSQKGIEYSYLKNGTVIPHSKYVTGQLYARTFTLASLSESLWMLKQLKVNAKEGDFQPLDAPEKPEWYYHPVIKAALDVTRHVEVRDGIIETWSNELPGDTTGYPPTAAAPPALTARDIKLYRV